MCLAQFPSFEDQKAPTYFSALHQPNLIMTLQELMRKSSTYNNPCFTGAKFKSHPKEGLIYSDTEESKEVVIGNFILSTYGVLYDYQFKYLNGLQQRWLNTYRDEGAKKQSRSI
jgi:hypothetical protein